MYFVDKVELDGQLIELPEIEAIVILNISSWGGGCQPWGAGHDENNQLKPARYGKLVYALWADLTHVMRSLKPLAFKPLCFY